MSLAIDGVWKAGVWAETVWADGVWREGAPAEVEATNTGGWGAWDNERDDEQIRQQRIRMGILPEDKPDEVAESLEAVQQEARRKARQLAQKSDALTAQIIDIERKLEAQENANQVAALEVEKAEALANLSIIQRNQNAQAVLVMLSLI